MDTFQLEHVPRPYTILAGLFKDVTNVAFLHQQLLARNENFEYALIDASSVISTFQVLAAVYKAITIHMTGQMKTPNIHSEIVCSLSPTNNVLMGAPSAASSAGLAAGTDTSSGDARELPEVLTAQDVRNHVAEHVHGSALALGDEALSPITDWPKVRKYYKLNGVQWLDGIKDEPAKRREMEMLVLGGMALRGL